MQITLNSEKINWADLRKQKQWLVNDGTYFDGEAIEEALGLIHLLDYIQDQAEAVLGAQIVWGDLEPSNDPYWKNAQ